MVKVIEKTEVNIEDLKDLQIKIDSLAGQVEILMDTILLFTESHKVVKPVTKAKIAEIKAKDLESMIEIKKLTIGDKTVEVHMFEKFVIIDGHKAKIYDVKKGRLFNYEGKPVYLSFNSLQTV